MVITVVNKTMWNETATGLVNNKVCIDCEQFFFALLDICPVVHYCLALPEILNSQNGSMSVMFLKLPSPNCVYALFGMIIPGYLIARYVQHVWKLK